MSFLDSIIGGVKDQLGDQLGEALGDKILGGGAAGGVGDLLKGQGGVGGLLEKFGQNGLGDVAASWIGKGANAAITPEQITAVLGSGPVAAFAEKLGVSPEQASATLSAVLPQLIDKLTPDGQAPSGEAAGGLLDALPGGLGGGLGDVAGGLLGGLLKR